MFSNQHRFHGRLAIRRVQQGGQVVRGQQIALKLVSRSNQKPFRVAVSVSKKVSGSAVTRNRIRRRVYEAIRTSPYQLPAGCDAVIMIYGESFAEMPSVQLMTIINDLLKKATDP